MRRFPRLLVCAITLGLTATGLSYSSAPSLAAPDLSETCDGFDEGRDAVDNSAPAPDGASRTKPSHHLSTLRVDKSRDTEAAFAVLPDVNLPSKVEAHLRLVADKYHKATGKGLVVTSGTRDASAQAAVIYDKLAAGDDIVKLYKAKAAALELKGIFDDGKGAKSDKNSIVEAMASAIRAQIKKGVFISAHLRAGAADVRSTDMSAADKRRFVEASEVGGLSVMLEATPPHFHLQLE